MCKVKKLSQIFRSAVEAAAGKDTTSASTSDASLKHYVSSIGAPSPHASLAAAAKFSAKPRKSPPISKPEPPSPVSNSSLPVLGLLASDSDSEDTTSQLSKEILSALRSSDLDSNRTKNLQTTLNVPWFSQTLNKMSMQRREVCRSRKQRFIFKSTQHGRCNKLVMTCAQYFGTDATIQVLGKLGCETGLKEYNAMIKICMNEAISSDDEDVVIKQLSKCYQILRSMKEQGFQLEEETFASILVYLIDMHMVWEFHFFCEAIKGYNPSCLAKLGYYEMLLYIRVDDQKKIQELCNRICSADGVENTDLCANYLAALCESDRKEEILQLLDVIDITKFSSLDHIVSIFKLLGRLSLESFMEKFLLAFKESDCGAEIISTLILNYATSIPNLAVADVALKFKNLHKVLELVPSTTSYEKLIIYSCKLLKVHAALDIVDQMCEEGLPLSINVLHSILHASEESFDFNLVGRIYSLICHHDLKPSSETYRIMITLCVKMKDFEGAYSMLKDLMKLNLQPTASMYNAIMGGYFREKNINSALMVLKQMEDAGVRPDIQTYSYLIGNCGSEEQIIKYYKELTSAGIVASRPIFMALINAYASCGQFEKAKQVLLVRDIPIKDLNRIKCALMSALASHGQMSDALQMYEEIKEAGGNLEPKSVISLIEHYQSEGKLTRLIKLLEELRDPDYWVDGCCRVIIHCIRHKHLNYAVNLLKQLKDRFCNDEITMDVLFDEAFAQVAEMEPVDMQIGMDLLQAIKHEVGVSPSRKCLDFLLSTCVRAKDLHNALLIWKEYQEAGLPYNTLSYLRMYQALLACGDHKSADVVLAKIPQDDAHVRFLTRECQQTYYPLTISAKKAKKKRKKGRDKITREAKGKRDKETR